MAGYLRMQSILFCKLFFCWGYFGSPASVRRNRLAPHHPLPDAENPRTGAPKRHAADFKLTLLKCRGRDLLVRLYRFRNGLYAKRIFSVFRPIWGRPFCLTSLFPQVMIKRIRHGPHFSNSFYSDLQKTKLYSLPM
jgi:hypothetical protein